MASLPPPAPLLEPGYRIDRYELLCRIGQGGMATIWLARTANTRGEERLVAIKTILPDLATDDAVRTMFIDEARITTAIDHPNVARTLQVGEHWGLPYLVLELVEGESVEQLCKSLGDVALSVPAAIVVRIIADAALGLHAAHELTGADGESLDVVHRDMAPANILVDDLGCSRVIDFGVAKASERFTPETAVGVMKGRVPYMAPEHASGGTVDRRTDIWALGAVAYFMLAQRYPFDGPNDAARLIRILGTDEPDPLPDTVAPALRDVVFRALSKDPDARYGTAAELATALAIAKLPATHAEVASFFRDNLATETRARRALIEKALAAADIRARARELLDGPVPFGTSHSYRPPPVMSDDAASSGNGTLDTVTRSHLPPPGPRARSWVPWATAGVVGVVVIVAFALGSLSARAPEAGGAASAGVVVTTPSASIPTSNAASRTSAPPTAPMLSVAETQARVLAEARAKADADAARAAAEAAEAKKVAAAAASATPRAAPAWVMAAATSRPVASAATPLARSSSAPPSPPYAPPNATVITPPEQRHDDTPF